MWSKILKIVSKKLVKDSFVYKRKTIRNNLKDYNLSIRAENLELEIFVEMANRLVKIL